MNRRSVSSLFSFPRGVAAGAAALLFLATSGFGVPAPAQQEKDSLQQKVITGIRRIMREKNTAVVRVRCFDDHGEINGSGFYIDPTGTVCTLGDMVRNAREITIVRNGQAREARIEALDPRSGVAFLKSSNPSEAGEASTFLTPHANPLPDPDAPVLGIGFPQDGRETAVLGMVTGIETHAGEEYFCVPQLTANLPLSAGEGGSPILDLSGELVGMVVAGEPQGGRCRILPARAIEKLHQDLLCYGHLNPGWVGAVVEETAVPDHGSRTRIASVGPGSPAEKAGLRAGDTVVSFGSCTVTTPGDVLTASFYMSAGEPLRIGVSREGQTRLIELRCAEKPAPPQGDSEDQGDHLTTISR